jgi:hypothetical protein
VSARTKLGTTAEKWAASRGFGEIVELLREAAAAQPPRPPEPDSRPHVETEEVRPVRTSSFEPQDLPFEPRETSVERQGPPVERQPAPVEQQELKARMEAMFASSSVGAALEPDAATAAGPISGPSNNAPSDEGAASESSHLEEVTAATFAAPDGSDADSTPQRSPSSSGSRFRSVLQSWPVTVGAVVLILASAASVFLLRRGAETSGNRAALNRPAGHV